MEMHVINLFWVTRETKMGLIYEKFDFVSLGEMGYQNN